MTEGLYCPVHGSLTDLGKDKFQVLAWVWEGYCVYHDASCKNEIEAEIILDD